MYYQWLIPIILMLGQLSFLNMDWNTALNDLKNKMYIITLHLKSLKTEFFRMEMYNVSGLNILKKKCLYKNLMNQNIDKNVTGYPGVWESINISGLNSSVIRALAQYAKGTGFESRFRLNFLSPVTGRLFGSVYIFLFNIPYRMINLKRRTCRVV